MMDFSSLSTLPPAGTFQRSEFSPCRCWKSAITLAPASLWNTQLKLNLTCTGCHPRESSQYLRLRRPVRTVHKKTATTTVAALLPVSGPSSVHMADALFTLGTAIVMPVYTMMILAPHSQWTRKLVESDIPFVVLGIIYLYLLALSWTSETPKLMFSSKYWLPELPGITKMFSSTLTVASAWIHLMAVDLFAGRQIFLDGLQHAVDTRHSLVLCLLVCPIGILLHVVTKTIVLLWRRAHAGKEDAADLVTLS